MTNPAKTAAKSCQICDGQNAPLYVIKEELCLYKCRDCGLVYLDPMPSPECISSLYSDAYRGTTTGYFTKAEKKLRRARRLLKKLRNKSIGNRFLDIGCNGGFAMEAARESGFSAHGIELDAASLDYARRHFPQNEYFMGTVQEYQAKIPFDVVYCSEVIEHIPDVNSFLSAIAQLMKPSAILYLTTPDIGHWRRPKNIHAWDAFCPPSHCLYFTPSNLTRLLTSHGFDIIKVRWAWKPGIRLYARRLP
ncbi:MAG: class I SAM-dependent methyltransferase [Pseudomonadota bacterium]|nr:class I SAM-dependent methyltransferase [Pseudomonadota bacterium]